MPPTDRVYRPWSSDHDKILLEVARRREAGLPASSSEFLALALDRSLASLKQRFTQLRRKRREAAEAGPVVMRACACCGRQFARTRERRMLCARCYTSGDGGMDV